MTELPLGALIFLALVATFGTIGNLFIIGAVCLSKKLRTRGHAFVVNLAIADLVVTAYIMPIGLVTSQFDAYPFGQTVCSVNAFLIMTSCGVSTQSLMMIALERYYHICKTKQYTKVFSPKLVALYIFVTWLYSTIWTSQGWTGWTNYIYGDDIFVCLFSGQYSISYDICLVVFGMLIPIGVLVFAYTRIFRKVHDSNMALAKHRKDEMRTAIGNNHKSLKQEFRFIITLFTIVLVFILCWTPAAVVLTMSGVWLDMPDYLYTISVWLAFGNSAMNSVIYGVLNKNFRAGYVHMLSRICCCCCRSDKTDRNSLVTSTQGGTSAGTAETNLSATSAQRAYMVSKLPGTIIQTTELPAQLSDNRLVSHPMEDAESIGSNLDPRQDDLQMMSASHMDLATLEPEPGPSNSTALVPVRGYGEGPSSRVQPGTVSHALTRPQSAELSRSTALDHLGIADEETQGPGRYNVDLGSRESVMRSRPRPKSGYRSGAVTPASDFAGSYGSLSEFGGRAQSAATKSRPVTAAGRSDVMSRLTDVASKCYNAVDARTPTPGPFMSRPLTRAEPLAEDPARPDSPTLRTDSELFNNLRELIADGTEKNVVTIQHGTSRTVTYADKKGNYRINTKL